MEPNLPVLPCSEESSEGRVLSKETYCLIYYRVGSTSHSDVAVPISLASPLEAIVQQEESESLSCRQTFAEGEDFRLSAVEQQRKARQLLADAVLRCAQTQRVELDSSVWLPTVWLRAWASGATESPDYSLFE